MDDAGTLRKVSEEGTTDELYDHICNLIPQFLAHCYTKRMQAEAYNKERENAGFNATDHSTAALLQVDFSENYTCVFKNRFIVAAL